jgi:hypothetical protein
MAAASWYELPDGSRSRHDERALRALADGIADGDPVVLDALPAPDLSGQWADRTSGPALYRDACDTAGLVESGGEYASFDAICDAYESAFASAVCDEVSRRVRYQLAPID